MRTVTTYRRWLGLLLMMLFFVGTAQAQRNVTLKLNTATLPDTTNAGDLVEVRGAIDGAGVTLPDGNVIDWNDTSTLEPTNVGGDYWEVSFQIPDNAEMAFKFYNQLAEDDLIGGWEDGDNNWVIEAGTGDVMLENHFFNKTGGDIAYDWAPYEHKEDSVAVHFRVWANTESSLTAGYDRTSSVVGVRGDPLEGAGMLDWGVTLPLSAESDDDTKPGYHLFSKTLYYPVSAAGTDQAYKFIIGDSGWESNEVGEGGTDNRMFTIPASDTTLHWVYFDNSTPPAAARVTQTVIFSVDLTPLEAIGIFSRARGDTLQVRGVFNGWGCSNPDLCLLQRVPGEDIFEGAYPLTLAPGTEMAYKFFLDINNQPFIDQFGEDPPSGWEEPISTTGSDRLFTFEGSTSGDQFLGDQFFNDILPGNIIAAGNSVEVTFAVDMAPAFDSQAQPFDPANGDSVLVNFGDPIWRFTQGLDQYDKSTVLTDDDEDGVYVGTVTVDGPTYSGLQYQYAYGQAGAYFDEPGLGLGSEPGRRRTRFIVPNPDGTWPTTWSFPQETFRLEATALPFETNPALATAIEEVGGELPAQIALSQNFPNPFNPTTAFEYGLTRSEHVTIRVYDVLGREVATLVDGVQPAATYRLTFDASNLASGTYLYRLETASQVLTRTMVLLK